VLGEITTGKKKGLSEYLQENPGLFHPALKEGLDKVYGYASDVARHGKEGTQPAHEDAEFVVATCAAVCTLLTRKHPKMTDLAVTRNTAMPVLPAIIAGAGDEAALRFLEFFTVNIRNKNTRAAYGRAAADFLRWCERQGIGELGRIQPVHVAAYIELLQLLFENKDQAIVLDAVTFSV
jgi:hypothetical protein